MATRTFKHNGKNKNISVTTELTDAEAIAILGGINADGFNGKCAFEINKQMRGYKGSPALVAWGFHNAENPQKGKAATVCLSVDVQGLVACGRPLAGEVDGHVFKVVQHGGRSKYCGMYMVTDGGEYPSNEFYGRADGAGNWSPTKATPQAIIDQLTKG